MRSASPLLLTLARLLVVVVIEYVPGLAAADELTPVGRWKLGGPGGWDYLLADPGANRLFVTRGDRVVVVDTLTGKETGRIEPADGVHGVALAHDLGHGFVSNGKANSVTVFDLKTLGTLQEIHIDGRNPDAILYDAATHQVFAFNGRSGDATVIDAGTNTVTGTIALGGKPEFAVSDGHGRVFVNIEDKSQIAAIDAAARKVVATWPLADCEDPTGLAIDLDHHRLFSSCQNERMAVTDATSGRQVASVRIGKGPDGAAFDPKRSLVFTSNGEDGTLSVVHEDDPDHYRVVRTVPTQKSARTMAIDPATHRVFLSAAEFSAAPPPTADHPKQRAPMVADSFTVLVVGY